MSPTIELPDALWAITISPEWPPTLADGDTLTAFTAELTFCDATVYSRRYEEGGYDSDTFIRARNAMLGGDFDLGIEIVNNAFKTVCADRMRVLMNQAFAFATRTQARDAAQADRWMEEAGRRSGR